MLMPWSAYGVIVESRLSSISSVKLVTAGPSHDDVIIVAPFDREITAVEGDSGLPSG